MCELPCMLLGAMAYSHPRSLTCSVLISLSLSRVANFFTLYNVSIYRSAPPLTHVSYISMENFHCLIPRLCVMAATQFHGAGVTMVNSH